MDELEMFLRGFSPNAPRVNERERIVEAADRLILYREALEAITREDGKNSRGFIDWQRCVDRIQAVARAVLSRSGG